MEKKYYRIHLRMRKKHYKALKEQSQQAGMTMNKFMMKRLMETQPFTFPAERISELAAYTNEIGTRINEIARFFNSGFGNESLLDEAFRLLSMILDKTHTLVSEKKEAEQKWIADTGYTPSPYSTKEFRTKTKETYGLMLRLNEEQHKKLQELLKMKHYSQKLLLQRLIYRCPIDANVHERLRAYDRYNPCNRVGNNVLQILRQAEKMNMDSIRINKMQFMMDCIYKDANELMRFTPLEEYLETIHKD